MSADIQLILPQEHFWVAEVAGTEPPRMVGVSDKLGQLLTTENPALAIRFADEPSCQRVCDSAHSGTAGFLIPSLRKRSEQAA